MTKLDCTKFKFPNAVFVVPLLFLFTIPAQGQYNLAIKLEVSTNAKALIADIVKAATYASDVQIVATPHLTIGFVENLPSQAVADEVGERVTKFIDAFLQNNQVRFSVLTCDNLFDHITGLTPDQTSANGIKALNAALEKKLGESRIQLNGLTTNAQYTPHISLALSTTGAHRLAAMNKKIAELKAHGKGELFFSLQSSSVRVIPQKKH